MLLGLLPSLLIDGSESLVRRGRKIPIYSLEGRKENYDFSIIVPSYNASKTIKETLSSLELYKEKTVVVDDGSTDNTSEIAKNMGFEVIRNEENGKKVGAIRRGLEVIGSKYTVLIDADTTIEEPQDLPKLIQALYDESLIAAGAQVLPKNPSNLLGKLQYIEYKLAMEIGRKSMRNNICISGAFGAFDIKQLKEITEIQNVNPKFEGEDYERTLYLIERGKTGYFPDFIVRTEVPESWKKLTKQRIRWGYGFLDKSLKFSEMLKRKDEVGATFWFNYIVNIGLHPLKLAFLPFLLLTPIDFFLFCSAYSILTGVLFYSVSSKEEKKYLKYVPLYPLYSIYNLTVPTTIGYAKKLVRK